MPIKEMRVTGLVIQSTNTYQLRGTGINNQLTSITVTKDTNGEPPAAGKASGSVGDISANVSQASLSVWNDMLAKFASFPFKAIVEYTGNTGSGAVTDLSFGNVSAAAATRHKIAEDVEALRFIAQRLAAKLLPELHGEESPTGIRRGLKQ